MDSLRLPDRAKAAVIVFKTIRPQILENMANLAKLREIIEPANGFERSRAIIIQVGSKPINDFMSCIKCSALPEGGVGKLRRLSKETFWNPEIIFPESWEIWRAMITKYHLCEILPFAGWVEITHHLSKSQIFTPLDLAQVHHSEALALDTSLNLDGNLSILRQSAK